MLSETKKDVFLCVCVCLKKNEAIDVEYLLEMKKKEKHFVREDTVCRGKNEV